MGLRKCFFVGERHTYAIQVQDGLLDGEVLKLDPSNSAAVSGLTEATSLKAQQAPRWVESETQFIPAASAPKGPGGFALDGVEAKQGTVLPKFPAQILIEHAPEAPMPGQPYVLRVRLHNSGQRAIQVKFLEIETTFGSRPPMGRGLAMRPQADRIEVLATGLLHEVQGVWTEDHKHGSIQATVVLVGNDKLVKTTNW